MKYTTTERHAQRVHVEECMRMGIKSHKAIAQWVYQKIGGPRAPSIEIVKRRIREVQALWAGEEALTGTLAHNKAAALRRLYETRLRMQGSLGKGEKGQPGFVAPVKPNWPSIVRCEELISKIEGTQAPIKVQTELNVSATMLNVIAAMTPERMEALITKHREMRAQAEVGKRALLGLSPFPTPNVH